MYKVVSAGVNVSGTAAVNDKRQGDGEGRQSTRAFASALACTREAECATELRGREARRGVEAFRFGSAERNGGTRGVAGVKRQWRSVSGRLAIHQESER